MKITLEEWAAKSYSKPPTARALGNWRRQGQIYPPPERVGREWFVPEDAVRVVDQPPPNLAARLRRAA